MFSEKRDGFLYHITMGFNFSHRSKISSKTSSVLRGRMKLAGLFAMSEEEFEGLLASVEGSERFNLLRKTGVLSVAGFSKARFNARNFAGYGLRMEAGGLPELVDGKYNYARLIQGIGREKFETLFLKNEPVVIVPMPLHPARERERGYNQSVLIARRLAALGGGVEASSCQRGYRHYHRDPRASCQERNHSSASARGR